MRDNDLADSPLASFTPDFNCDTIRDFLRERFAALGEIPSSLLDLKKVCFEMIDAAIADAGGDAAMSATSAAADPRQFLGALFHLSRSGERETRMRAFCLLRLLGKEGRSFQALADDLGFKTRATPHKCYRDIQREFGNIPGRGDKSPVAREKCRQRRIGAKRERVQWSGLNLWNRLSSPLAA